MKIFSNKVIFILLMMAMITLSGWLGFNAYKSYNTYSTLQINANDNILIEEIDSFIEKLEEEELQSAIYFGSNGKEGFDKLKDVRNNVDIALNNLLMHFDNYKFNESKERILSIKEDLKSARVTVDALNGSFNNIISDIYYKKIFLSLLKESDFIANNDTSNIIKDYLNIYIKYILPKENVNVEKALVLSKLLSQTPMNSDELVSWDKSIINQSLPDLSSLSDIDTKKALTQVIPVEKYNEIASNERIQIFYKSRDGKYNISPKEWNKKLEQKSNYLSKASEILSASMKSFFDRSLSYNKKLVIINLIEALVALFVLLILFLVYRSARRDTKLFENTLKDIGRVLDEDQQKELKQLIEKKDTNAIYAFLTKTIDEANRSKDLFLANMSHEIRTPLNGIVGFTQLLKSTEVNDEQKEFISVIESSSENLLTIVNDILDLSKIKADKIELEEIEFNTFDKFQSAIESYAARAAEKDIDLRVYIDPTLPSKLIGDPTKISQVIVNLISNAIKFTGIRGIVNVDIVKKDENENGVDVHFSVKDTGIGISKEQKEKIFEAFAQADVSTSRKYGGTGLGLAISSKLVEFMGGQLDIDSVEGEGSTFFFTLKLKKASSQDNELQIPDLSNYSIVLALPEDDIANFIDDNYAKYAKYCNANFSMKTYSELVEMQKNNTLPDVILIDHRYCHISDELDKCISFDTKIVLFSTSDKKKTIEEIENKIDRIVYKPANFTKTIKALEVVFDEKKVVKKQQDRVKNIHFENLKVLVAEDNAINQKLIKNILEGLGAEVTLVENGKLAYEQRQMNEYDIIFMDIQMPIMGGVEATQAIKEYENKNRKHHIPIVALTANAITGDKEKYLKDGMNGYLSKPIVLSSLVEILAEYFSNKIVEEDKQEDIDKLGSDYKNNNIKNEDDIPCESEECLVEKLDIETLELVEEPKNIQKRIPTTPDEIVKEKKADILIYKSTQLAANVYASILKNLGFSVDIATASNIFMDKLENNYYTYVLFDAEPLMKIRCLIVDLIRDREAKPFMFICEEDNNACCDTLSLEPIVSELKSKLSK
jgi:signal transduction histidine kinase/CheY-like chemotaxis protein